MKYEKEYREIAKLIRQANWLMIDAEFKYRQINNGTSISNDRFRKLMDDAEIATARCHNEFMAMIEKDPNLSSDANVPLSVFPGEAANAFEVSLALDIKKIKDKYEKPID